MKFSAPGEHHDIEPATEHFVPTTIDMPVPLWATHDTPFHPGDHGNPATGRRRRHPRRAELLGQKHVTVTHVYDTAQSGHEAQRLAPIGEVMDLQHGQPLHVAISCTMRNRRE